MNSGRDREAETLTHLLEEATAAVGARGGLGDGDEGFRLGLVLRMSGITLRRARDPLPDVDSSALARFRRMAAGRPPVLEAFAQLPIDDASTIRRASAVHERTGVDEEILLVGDDDLTALALRSLGREGLVVVDLDEDLLTFLAGADVETHRVDLTRDEVPTALRRRFGAVILDPVRSFSGAAAFLGFATEAAGREGRVFWCDHPDWNPGYTRAANLLSLDGWRIEEVLENLHAYAPSAAFVETVGEDARSLDLEGEPFVTLARTGRAWSHLHVLVREA